MTILPVPDFPDQNDRDTFIEKSIAYHSWLLTEFAPVIEGLAVATGPGSFLDGSATTPGMNFASDTNTGIYRIGADIMGLSAGGAERVRVTTAGMQVTGLLTGTAVTQTAVDTTANRLLKVGDFGLGVLGAPTTLTDLDSTTIPGGLHRVINTTTGTFPSGVSQFASVIMVRYSSDTGRMLYMPTNSALLYSRNLASGVWGSWGPVFGIGSVITGALGSAAAPGFSFTGDLDTGMYSAGADQINWATAGSLRLSLSSSGMTMGTVLLATAGSASAPSLSFSADTNTGILNPAADSIAFAVGGAERARLNATGLRLGGTSANAGVALDIRGETANDATVNVHRNTDDTGGPILRARKSRGTTSSPTVPLANDTIGQVAFGGLETGTTYTDGASINAIAEADFASGSTPARLSLRTVTTGSTTLTERVRIDATKTEVTGRFHLNAAEGNAVKVTIADDAVYTFTPGRTGGFMLMSAGGHVGTSSTFEPHSAQVFFDVGSSAAFCAKSTGISGVGGNVDCVTGTTLTGTTGTDGNVTVSAKTDGTITIENRRGASTVFTLWVF